MSRRQIPLKIAPGLHVRFWSCNFSATKIASSCRDKNCLCKRALSVARSINQEHYRVDCVNLLWNNRRSKDNFHEICCRNWDEQCCNVQSGSGKDEHEHPAWFCRISTRLFCNTLTVYACSARYRRAVLDRRVQHSVVIYECLRRKQRQLQMRYASTNFVFFTS